MARLDDTFEFDAQAERSEGESDARLRPIILAVGDVRNWMNAGRALPADSQIAFAEFHEITEELLLTLLPDVVLSPVLCRAFDCLDLAQTLHGSGFRGRLRIMAPDMPNPRVIQSEIRALCPGLDVAFIFCGKEAIRRLH